MLNIRVNNRKTNKIGALISSGKDSIYATYMMQRKGFQIACIITIESQNNDSYMFHTPNVKLAKLQAEAMGISIITAKTPGLKEEELSDLKNMLLKAKKEYDIEGIVTGALHSEYQKQRIDKICLELGLESFAPLWRMDQEVELRAILRSGFEIIFSSIAAEGLDKSWLGRRITKKDVDRLVELNNKYKINIAGEGGEYESLVLDCPLFKKKIRIIDSEIIEENQNAASIIVKKAVLAKKI